MPPLPSIGPPSLTPPSMAGHNPFARSAGTANPFAAPPRAPTPVARIPQPASLTPAAGFGGIFGPPSGTLAPPLSEPPLPVITVPPPAPILGRPPAAENAGLAALFDDIPRSNATEPSTLTDGLDGGVDVDVDVDEFMLTPPNSRPPIMDPSLMPTTGPLGADLVAAFEANKTAPIGIEQVVDIATDDRSFGLDAEQSTMSMPSPLIVRLRSLAERLRSEGRETDADLLAQALALVELAGG